MERINIIIEEAVNGYRIDIYGLGGESIKENTDDREQALRIVERKINDMLIAELERLVAAHNTPSVEFHEASNG